jgi:hypothetical protein
MSMSLSRLCAVAAWLAIVAVTACGCGPKTGRTEARHRERVPLCVDVPHADVHSRPSTDSEVVGRLLLATNVWADSLSGEWWRIEYDEKHAWLHASLVDTGHLLEPLVVHSQAGMLEGELQQRAVRQEAELAKLRANEIGAHPVKEDGDD